MFACVCEGVLIIACVCVCVLGLLACVCVSAYVRGSVCTASRFELA